MSVDAFPQVAAACAASLDAIVLQRSALTRLERLHADQASRRASEQAMQAYRTELLPRLFGGSWHLSRRNAHFPAAILQAGHRPALRPACWQTFDHPLVFRQAGTSGPDHPRNTVLIGQPYAAVAGSELSASVREEAAELADRGWSIHWSPDLSTHYPGWTQLIIARFGIEMSPAAHGFLPIALPGIGVNAWHEWARTPEGVRVH
ncbi:MAG: hypothetical protein BGO51_28465 [Rhodospirillales bacterium 69-11]|nr:hypothetical protein [Rhodospirillales bacterium]MBN8927168.1 hypothetical protein [Rhodospirillales bacterium]OJW25237.1 MAG: hypothetical protein BGO51_28465 [Rhodospirillales bacterium 69-11]